MRGEEEDGSWEGTGMEEWRKWFQQRRKGVGLEMLRKHLGMLEVPPPSLQNLSGLGLTAGDAARGSVTLLCHWGTVTPCPVALVVSEISSHTGPSGNCPHSPPLSEAGLWLDCLHQKISKIHVDHLGH